MPRLHLDIFEQTATDFQLRFINAQQNQTHARPLTAQELKTFVEQNLSDYHNGTPLHTLGNTLFDWLNGPESALDGCRELHIPTQHDLRQLALGIAPQWAVYLHPRQPAIHARAAGGQKQQHRKPAKPPLARAVLGKLAD